MSTRTKKRDNPTTRPSWRDRKVYATHVRRNPQERACGCGKRATVFKQGYAVCADCHDKHIRGLEVRGKVSTVRPPKPNAVAPKTHTEMRHDGDLEGFAKPEGRGWGSETILDQMLRALPPLPTRKAA